MKRKTVSKGPTTLNKKRNTQVYRNHKGETVIKLYKTNIVEFNESKIKLQVGTRFVPGSGVVYNHTQTTFRRMNEASYYYGLGYRVFQKNFVTYVDFNEKTIPFTEGMVIARGEN